MVNRSDVRDGPSGRPFGLLAWQVAWLLVGLTIWMLFEWLRLHPERELAELANPVSWLLLLVPCAASITTWCGHRFAGWPARTALAVGSALLSAAALLLLILVVGTPIHLALGGHL